MIGRFFFWLAEEGGRGVNVGGSLSSTAPTDDVSHNDNLPLHATKTRRRGGRGGGEGDGCGRRPVTNEASTDPDLYDTVVRRFQTPAEREAEGRSRGWGKVLESSLMRGEARLERVASSLTGDAPLPRPPHPHSTTSSARKTSLSEVTSGDMAAAAAAATAVDAGLVDSKPTTKEEGRAAWEEFLRERFVAGADEEFDYAQVDGNEELDEMEHRDREEEWFDEEDPEWADDDSEGEGEGDEEEQEADVMMGDRRQGGAEPRKGKREKILTGQTGVQDY